MPIIPLDAFLDKANNHNSPFDYLIVGGGSTGLVVANRLTENPNINVGVIETGVYHAASGSNPVIDIPGYMGRALRNPTYDWGFLSEPQASVKNRSILLPRGRGLGGSSLINYLALTRPSKQEYDALETNFGNRGWTWENLLECMKKTECFSQHSAIATQGDSKSFVPIPDPSVHGTNGPIHHSYAPLWSSQNHNTAEVTRDTSNSSDLFFQTLEQLGVPANPEPCNGNNMGFAKFLMAIDPNSCTRSSAVTGYFDPIVGSRDNLFVLTGALVTRVLLENSNTSDKPRAIGVEIYVPGTQERVEVRNIRREVILSAGTFKTPDILECSGIGDSTFLKQQGITPLVDLPGVGNNLQDHTAISFIAEIDSKYATGETLFDPVELSKHEQLYRESKQGLLASSLAQSLAFVSLEHVSGVTETTPDSFTNRLKDESQSYLTGLSLPQEVQRGVENQYELQEKWLSDVNQATIELTNVNAHLPTGPGGSTPDIAGNKRYTSLVASLMHPFSRGTVHHSPGDSATTEPQHPKVDPKVLSHPLDYPLLLQGAKYILRMAQTEPLKSAVKAWAFPAELSTIDLKEALQPESGSVNKEQARLEQVLENHIMSWVRSVYHPIGTAAMMPREDGGVVDDRLRVYGVDGLRVADLSILPYEISAHTVSAAYAIGEKAAVILKQDYLQQ